jgi:hypothetical protein
LLPSLYPKHFGGRSTVAWAEQKEDYSHVWIVAAWRYRKTPWL